MSGAVSDLPNIAFCGKAGAGKSTAADFLTASGGYYQLHIAQPLKDIAAKVLGEEGRKNRRFLQKLGQLVRDEDQDAWVRLTLDQMATAGMMRNGQVFAIDDLRFPNEWWLLKENGFVIIRVVADRQLRVDRLKRIGKLQDEAQLDDISETALDDFEPDYELDNNGFPNELYQAVKAIVFKERKRV